jgi:hypothetical protein
MRKSSASKTIGGVTTLEFVGRLSALSEEKQAKLLLFAEYLAGQTAGVRALNKGDKLDWKATKSRGSTVARVLNLPHSEVTRALKYNGRSSKFICEFAIRYNQNLNWLLLGDVDSLCHDLAWAIGWRPADWTPEMEKIDLAGRKRAKKEYLPLLTKPRPRKAA